jgi:peptidoglycan-associated lipoprotein
MGKKVWLAVALVMILPVMVFMVSCSKEAVRTEPVSTTGPEVRKAPVASDGEAGQDEQLMERLRAEAAARDAAKAAFVNENIHFAFDSSALSVRARRILSRKADYLRSNPDTLITIEGHCDDRGTDAYNNALGERRADSVKIFLVDLGIDTNRLSTVSFGEKRPIAPGHDEASWAENRRAQFVIN